MSWLFGPSASTTQFDELVDKATSELLPPDSDEVLLLGLECSDLIRARTIEAPLALKSVRRRLAHKNPNVQIQSLNLLDVLVKNSGESFLLAVGNGKDGWLAQLEEIARSTNTEARQAGLEHLQNWALAFQSSNTSASLSNSDLVHLYNRLRYTLHFPATSQAMTSSMITSMSAPEWIDSDLCQRCRTPFTVTNRKHHCRNCGGVFCGDCSSKKLKLEHLGIDQEVRVCDGCHKKLSVPGGKGQTQAPPSGFVPDNKGPSHRASASVSSRATGKSQEELDFEKAIALSLAESQSSTAPSASSYGQQSSLPGVGYGYDARPSQPPTAKKEDAMGVMPSKQMEEEDPDLAAAIRASLAEMPQASTSATQNNYHQQHASAPFSQPYASTSSGYTYTPQAPAAPSVPSYELAMSEFDSLDAFANVIPRRHVSIDDANELFYSADKHRGKMIRSLENSQVKAEMLSELNGKMQRAVRLYDNLLERRISRYNQPQQAHPQQAYHPQQQQQPYYNQHSQAQHPYQTQQPQQGYPYQQSQATASTPALHRQPSLAHEVPPSLHRQTSLAYDNQPYRQQHAAYSEQSAPQAERYAAQAQGPHVQPQQQYDENQYYNAQPTTQYDQHDQSQPQPSAPDPTSPPRQEHNLPPMSPGAVHAQHQPQYASQQETYGQQQGYASPTSQQSHLSNANQQQTGPDPHYNAGPTLNTHDGVAAAPHTQPLQEPASSQQSQPGSQLYDKAGNKLRLQGYYSAASFPAVPNMPVGGLPDVPNGEIAAHHLQLDRQQEGQEESRKQEEMLIQF